MITTILYGIGAIVFANLLLVAYIVGWEIASPPTRASVNKPKEQLRCECRRYSFPSPLCPRHGGHA